MYLLGFIAVIYKLIKEGEGMFNIVLLAAVVSSVFSNGIFVRPTAGYLLAIVLVLFYQTPKAKKVYE